MRNGIANADIFVSYQVTRFMWAPAPLWVNKYAPRWSDVKTYNYVQHHMALCSRCARDAVINQLLETRDVYLNAWVAHGDYSTAIRACILDVTYRMDELHASA